jgi:hypothetical protein
MFINKNIYKKQGCYREKGIFARKNIKKWQN